MRGEYRNLRLLLVWRRINGYHRVCPSDCFGQKIVPRGLTKGLFAVSASVQLRALLPSHVIRI